MGYQILITCAVSLIIAVCLCMPVDKRFLVNCSRDINCSDPMYDDSPEEICGTNGKTYNGLCELDMVNQNRFCRVGDFNQISMLHRGNCTKDKG